MAKRREIRNSTAEFLIFQAEAKEQGVEVYYKDENIWATQKAMATLFDVNVPAISKHLKNIFESGELKDDSVVSKMEITASDGKNYQTQFYSLDAIIAVGYRVNSVRATQFRQWATSVLKVYAIRGYMPRQNLRSTASYKIVCSRATLISIWVSCLLMVSKILNICYSQNNCSGCCLG